MIVGTTNPGKLHEIAAICLPLGVKIESRSFDIPETADTFEGNARLKAIGYSERCPGQYVLVEDSGLLVPALGGLPGPWSARFAGLLVSSMTMHEELIDKCDRELLDQLNNEKVLMMMKDVPFEERGAHFIICMNVVLDSMTKFTTTCIGKYGWIADAARGENGFGYDPIFVGADTFGKTYAEIDSHRKNLRSHRNEALKQFEIWLSDQVQRGIQL